MADARAQDRTMTEKEAREARLAAQLRENLKRRKAAGRGEPETSSTRDVNGPPADA
ncbi:MAG: hypothetical protein JWN21_1998 [Sphingomonas bacterium]|nr:hypothetical protein [Sphingomonas bacterium]